MRYHIVRDSDVARTPRVLQMAGMFDVPLEEKSRQSWSFDFDLDRPWNVGLIVGPSGAGKTTVARELFGGRLVPPWDWPDDRSVLDGFPADMGIKDVTAILSSVGFSSPPSWVRPYRVLSNGEQFRVHMARTIAECRELAVVDEFTSVVDRTVARVGASAVAGTVRRRGQKFVAVTCHYDVTDWLDPDWVFQPHLGTLEWRSLRGRPPVRLSIHQGDTSAWGAFRPHHYLTGNLHKGSRVFLTFADIGDGEWCPCGFFAVMSSFGHKGWRRGHRSVVLPDWQGIGIGNAMIEAVAEQLYAGEKLRFHAVTAAPAIVAHRIKHPEMWKLCRKTSMTSRVGRTSSSPGYKTATGRLTTSWEYIPSALRAGSRRASPAPSSSPSSTTSGPAKGS